MRRFSLYILIFLLAAVLVLPIFAYAAIVPCTTNCTICDLLKLIQNIINFFLTVSVPLATAMILAGGILILTAGDSQKRLEWGKTILTNAIVGFAIILAGWLFINTIMNWLVNPNVVPLPWNEIQCSVSTPTQTATQRQTTTQTEKQEWPSEQRFTEQYQQQQQTQQTTTIQEQSVIVPNLQDVSWTENETNSGEVATLRLNINMQQITESPTIYNKPLQRAFFSEIFRQTMSSLYKDFYKGSNRIIDPFNRIIDPFGMIFSTPKPTPKPKPIITPKIIMTTTPTPTPKITPKTTGQMTVTPVPKATPVFKRQQPKNFYFTFDFYNVKDNKKIDTIQVMFFLNDLMSSMNQMFQWNVPKNLPKNTQIKSQVQIKDEYGKNYGSYWSNQITVNPLRDQSSECIKLAGNNDSRKIVLMPLDGPIKDADGYICRAQWTDEEFGSMVWGENGLWKKTVMQYKDALGVPPFTENNFSIYYYNAGKPVSAAGQIQCDAYAPVYIAPCRLFRSTAYLHHRYVVMELYPPNPYYDLPHELAHILALLNDEYASGYEYTREEVIKGLGSEDYIRNCQSYYPDWWRINYNIPPIQGCYYGYQWFRDHEFDVMRGHVPYFGLIDLYFLNRAIFGSGYF